MFLDTAFLRDGEIYLRLDRTCDADPVRQFVPAYRFAICLTDGTEVGTCDLRIGHNDRLFYGGNIGYQVHEQYRGHHYAGKACRLLFQLAEKHRLGYVYITCMPENTASARTCEWAGCRLEGVFDLPEYHDLYQRGDRKVCVYRRDLHGGNDVPCEIIRMDYAALEKFPLNPYRPFEVIGRCVPSFDGREWSLAYSLKPENREKLYPNFRRDESGYIDSPSGAVFMAVQDGRCVGHIRVRAHFFDMGYVEEFAVEPEMRRQGVGKCLMDAARDWCLSENMKRMKLETQDNNVQACRFYTRYGFRLCGADSHKYDGSRFEDETALYFYMEL